MRDRTSDDHTLEGVMRYEILIHTVCNRNNNQLTLKIINKNQYV